jgi:hypothetical protein
MTLSNPGDVIVATADLDAFAGWLATVGFERHHGVVVPAAAAEVLWGLDRDTNAAEFGPPAVFRGVIWAVETPHGEAEADASVLTLRADDVRGDLEPPPDGFGVEVVAGPGPGVAALDWAVSDPAAARAFWTGVGLTFDPEPPIALRLVARGNGRPLPLRAGIHGPLFSVPSLEDAITTVGPELVSPVATFGGVRAVTGEAPGGGRFELWEIT